MEEHVVYGSLVGLDSGGSWTCGMRVLIFVRDAHSEEGESPQGAGCLNTGRNGKRDDKCDKPLRQLHVPSRGLSS